MDEELKLKMLEYLQEIEKSAGQVTDFAIEQTPLVIQEFLAWQIACGTLAIIVSVIGIVVGIVACRLVLRKVETPDEKAFGCFLVAAVTIVPFGILGGTSIAGVTKAVVAPRVVVLEKISDLVKNR